MSVISNNSTEENKSETGIQCAQSQYMSETECVQASEDIVEDFNSHDTVDDVDSTDVQFQHEREEGLDNVNLEPSPLQPTTSEFEPRSSTVCSEFPCDYIDIKQQCSSIKEIRAALSSKCRQEIYKFVRYWESEICTQSRKEHIYSSGQFKSESDLIKTFCNNSRVFLTEISSERCKEYRNFAEKTFCKGVPESKLAVNICLQEIFDLDEIHRKRGKFNKPWDLVNEAFDKTSLRELYLLPVQDFLYHDLISITVLPVLRQTTECSQQSTNDTASFPRFDPLLAIINRIADGERVPPQTTMRYEMLRFCTLRSYPKQNKPYITRLAQAGFYYANSSDEVVCYCCARRRRNWRETDIPMDVHRELNPNCSFLVNNSEVNVPVRYRDERQGNISSSAESSSRSPNERHLESSAEHSSQDNLVSTTLTTSGASVVSSESNLPAPNHNGLDLNETCEDTSLIAVSVEQQSGNGRSSLTVVSGDTRRNQSFSANAVDRPLSRAESQSSSRTEGEARPAASPKYPKYSSNTVRLTSFTDCTEIVVTAERLAEAGFFYAGFGDCVRCFQCGVGLRHWSEEDDPWIEHSRWSKECSFVRQVRGAEFVNLVQMAVQYSQNQSGREQVVANEAQNVNEASGHQTSSSAATADETGQLMHTDAAQSVLEMGYHPDIIKTAIQAVLASAGRESLRAANLMEKIFELEEVDVQQSSGPSDSPTHNIENHEQNDCSTNVATVQSRESTQTRSENTSDRRPEVTESQSDTNNTEGTSTTLNKNTTVDVTNRATGNDVTTQNHDIDTTREPVSHNEDTETTLKSTEQSREPDSSNALLTGNSHLLDAVVGATAVVSSANRKNQALVLEQKRLKEENEKLKQQSICIKCKTRDVCIVFLPCGHLVTCEDCAPTVRYCPVDKCGKYIKGTVRTYQA